MAARLVRRAAARLEELGFEELASRFLPRVELFTSYPRVACEMIVSVLVVVARHLVA